MPAERGIKLINRIAPYPPNFNKIAAKIIDPTTGASTWALGNQRCTAKRGNLTKKAKNKASKCIEDKKEKKEMWRLISDIEKKEKKLFNENWRIIIKRGRDANTV